MDNQKEIPKPIEEIPPAPKSAVVKTYAEDMADAISNAGPGDIKKIIDNEEEARKQEENLSPESQKNKNLMIASMVLIFMAIIFVMGIQLIKQKKSTVETSTSTNHIIFVEKNVFIEIDNLTKKEIIQRIKNEIKNAEIRSGEIEAIYLLQNKQVIDFGKIASILEMHEGEELRSKTNDSLIGVYRNEDGNSFFILLKGNSFTDIFGALKSWEAYMFSDLNSFFDFEINSNTNYLLTKDFDDTIVQNKNARILKDSTMQPVIEYIFADEYSAVIISKEKALPEILQRLASNRLSK